MDSKKCGKGTIFERLQDEFDLQEKVNEALKAAIASGDENLSKQLAAIANGFAQGEYKGQYSPDRVYQKDNMVLKDGVLFRSLYADNTLVPPSDTWAVLSQIVLTNNSPALANELMISGLAINPTTGAMYTKIDENTVVLLGSNVYAVDTIADLADADTLKTVIVRESKRGGTFVYNSSLSRWVKLREKQKTLHENGAGTKLLMTFGDVVLPQPYTYSHTQGMEIIGDKVFVARNVREDGLATGHPDEKFMISMYPLREDGGHEASALYSSLPFSFGHGQSLSHFKNDSDEIVFVGQGNTPPSDLSLTEEERTIVSYENLDKIITFPNMGRTIKTFIFDDSASSYSPTEYRVMAPFDKNNPDTWWYFGTPAISRDGTYLVVTFSDMRIFRHHKICVFLMENITQGDYTPIASKVMEAKDISSTQMNVLQSVYIYKDMIYVSLGGGKKGLNSLVIGMDMSLNRVHENEYIPSDLLSSSDGVEPEGLSMLHSGDDDYLTVLVDAKGELQKNRIYLIGQGKTARIEESLPIPAQVYSVSSDPTVVTPHTSHFSVVGWDAANKQAFTYMKMYRGAPRFAGRYIDMNYKNYDGGAYTFDRFVEWAPWLNRKVMFISPEGFGRTNMHCYIRMHGNSDSEPNEIRVKALKFKPERDAVMEMGASNRKFKSMHAKAVIAYNGYLVDDKVGVTSTFDLADGRTITVSGGIITDIG